ncbi:MAG: hypothetical protein GY739_14050, partial [Mesoflavibacter sp.]|nr:hypothetical protein [Mesoflavibacter sp.]
MKIDPNTLLIEESRSEDGFYSELGKRVQQNDLLKYAPKSIAIEIMRGRKSNREQVFLGSGSDEYCDFMYMINKIVSQADRSYNWEQKAAMRAQILANARKDILGHCSEMRRTGYYNHPSVDVVINQEDIYDAQGEIVLNACTSLITVLAHERYFGGFFQTSIYLSVMIRLKNQLLLNVQPSFDSGWYHWQAPERFARAIAYDELDH